MSGPQDGKSYWLFSCNPEIWSVTQALEEHGPGHEDSWPAARYAKEMQPGDRVIFWQAGQDSGIYAIGQLTGPVYENDEQYTEKDLDEASYLRHSLWVPVKYERILKKPLLRRDLKSHPILKSLGVMKFAQATNYRVSPEEWEAIQHLLKGKRSPVPESGLKDAILQYMEGKGLHFSPDQISAFYTALQAKGFVILSGISGTGKTRLAQSFAELLPQPESSDTEPKERSEAVALKVWPYMSRRSRIQIPKG